MNTQLHTIMNVECEWIVALIALCSAAVLSTASLHRETLALPDRYLPKVFGLQSRFQWYWTAANMIVNSICFLSALIIVSLVGLLISVSLKWDRPFSLNMEIFKYASIGVGLWLVLLLTLAAVVSMGIRNYFNSQRLSTEAKLLPAVVGLRSGRRLRGFLFDTSFLERSVHVKLLASDGQTHLISQRFVTMIFIGEHNPIDFRLAAEKYTETAAVFTLAQNGEEIFPPTKSYQSGRFRVFPSDKLDSRTRYVVAEETSDSKR